MKYIIDVPNQEYSYDEILHTLKLKFYDDNLSCEVFLDAEPYIDSDRKVIEDEVWSFVNFLENKLKASDYDFIFDDNSPYDKYTYQEAKDKFEEWHTQKQNEIKIGDEVVGIYSDGERTPPFVVLKIEGNYYYGIYSKTGEFVQGGLNYEKTGRHFDEVEELLKKIGSEE